MNVISSSKTTVLSSFPEFDRKSVYQHAQNEDTDFQFFALKHLFLEVNRKSGFEFLRIKNLNEKGGEISRVRKMRVDNLFCSACPKQDYEDIALGLSTGQIKLLNYKTSQFTDKFSGENSPNSVIFMDFNASDEYLSSVYENGIINIFGLKTKQKLETLPFDSTCTLARFHPTKRFHLAIATLKGSVYVYDIQSKRKILQSVKGHASPCMDLSMSPSVPDTLVTAGYDCVVNIYDTRKKTSPLQVRCQRPLSTVALSECGTYFCAGDLRGELVSYDLRQLKKELSSKKVHEDDSAVVRVAFVREDHSDGKSSALSFTTTVSSLDQQKMDSYEPINEHKNKRLRDSFLEMFDAHTNKSVIGASVMSLENIGKKNGSSGGGMPIGTEYSNGIIRRDSFFDMLTDHKRRESASRFSVGSNQLSIGTSSAYIDRKSSEDVINLNSIDDTSETNKHSVLSKSNDDLAVISPLGSLLQNKSRSSDDLSESAKSKLNYRSPAMNIDFTRPLPRNKELMLIKEEKLVESDSNDEEEKEVSIVEISSVKESDIDPSSSDKENRALHLSNKDIDYLKILPDGKNSTPNNIRRTSTDMKTAGNNNAAKHLAPNKSSDLEIILKEINSLRNDMNNMRSELLENVSLVKSEVNYFADAHKWEITNQMHNQFKEMREMSEFACQSLTLLRHKDHSVRELNRLRKENKELKARLEKN